VTSRKERYGNDGAEESVESQPQASPTFHEPLGNLAKGRRDSHIPTAPATKADGKVENQKQVSHFPTAATIYRERFQARSCRSAWLRPADRQKTKERKPSAASRHSGSSRIGMEAELAHLALESNLDFGLISGLENATGGFRIFGCEAGGATYRAAHPSMRRAA
jgi:hypothetical protein